MMEAVGQKRAVVLLSGGLDSATVLAIARQQGYEIAALSFQYGQRHSVELEAARRLAAAAGVARHVVMQIDLRVFGGSSLTTNQPVPKGRDLSQPEAGIPSTYVLDRSGTIRRMVRGSTEWDDSSTVAFVRGLLADGAAK